MRFLILLATLPLSAHDMWIEPALFQPEAGQLVSVRLRVGQDLLGDPLPRSSALVNQFVVLNGEGRKPVVGREGADPAGLFRVSAGMHVVGYYSNPSAVDQSAEKFNQYLKEEGLESIAALRARRNQSSAPVKELFSRCAKSLVLSGPATGADQALGFPLELVAGQNPYRLRPGDELPVRLTYQNRPLAGALVVAINRLNPMDKLSARTDSDGRVRFSPRAGGMWLVKAVHMIPAPPASGADWQSYWASLTFEMRAATEPRESASGSARAR